jgi:parallel beta-helix repeat protein
MNSKHFTRYLLITCALLLSIIFFAASQPTLAMPSNFNLAKQFHPNGIIYVDVDATGANNGTTWADAFNGLQPALDAAGSGDQVWVAAGLYKPSVAHGGTGDRYKSFQLKNGVALYGGFDPSVGDISFEDRDWAVNVVTLSGDLGVEGDIADNSYHVFYHPDELALDGTAVLDGFTITGGNANQVSWPHFGGGGMYNEEVSPTLRNCIFSGNTAYQYGAGMYNYYASPAVTNCTFSGNTADIGGGMYNDHDTTLITVSTFQDNIAGYGAGIYNYHYTGTISGCTFVNNTADGGGVASDGAAMYNQTSSPVITDTTFISNIALRDGGGIFNDESSPVLTNCTISKNSAVYNAGALYNRDSSSPKLINTTFSGNQSGYYGGAVYSQVNASPIFTNCTFYGNSAFNYSGGGIYGGSASTTTVVNSILWGDSPDEISSYDLASTPLATHSDIQGGYAGDGNLNLNPMFVNPVIGNFHLGGFSQCIDKGDNAASDLPDYDFEGDPRLIDGNGDGTPTVDMGVDESLGVTAFIHFYLPAVLNHR